MIVGVVPHWWN